MAALIYWRRAERLPASGVPVGAGRGVIRSARLLAVGRAGLAGLAGLALGRSREYDLRSLVVVAGAAAVVWSSTSQSWNLAAYRASIGQQSSRSGRADRGGGLQATGNGRNKCSYVSSRPARGRRRRCLWWRPRLRHRPAEEEAAQQVAAAVAALSARRRQRKQASRQQRRREGER